MSEKRFERPCGTAVVGITGRGTFHRPDSLVVKSFRPDAELILNIS
jgi:hypothetical protein